MPNNNDYSALCNFCMMGLMPLTIGLVFLTTALTTSKKITTYVTGYANYQNDDSCYSGYPIFSVIHNGKNYTSCSIAYYGTLCGCSNINDVNNCLQSEYPIGSTKTFYVDPKNYDTCDDVCRYIIFGNMDNWLQ
jgi:hypothetical protein